jgi:hypothetical protein
MFRKRSTDAAATSCRRWFCSVWLLRFGAELDDCGGEILLLLWVPVSVFFGDRGEGLSAFGLGSWTSESIERRDAQAAYPGVSGSLARNWVLSKAYHKVASML